MYIGSFFFFALKNYVFKNICSFNLIGFFRAICIVFIKFAVFFFILNSFYIPSPFKNIPFLQSLYFQVFLILILLFINNFYNYVIYFSYYLNIR